SSAYAFDPMLIQALMLVLISTSPAHASTPLPADFSDTQWKPLYEKNGIKVSRADFEDSSVSAFQAEAIIDAPLAKIAALLQDMERRPDWTPSLKQATILERKSLLEAIEYWHMGTPALIKEREAVV